MTIVSTIFWIAIAIVPSIFWLWFFIRYDWKRPEPPKVILRVFLFAMFLSVIVLGLQYFGIVGRLKNLFAQDWLNKIFYLFVLVAFVEEGIKFLAISLGAYFDKAYDEHIDGIVYGVTAGLGLAALENIISTIFVGGHSAFFRFATSTLMHALVGGIMGYYMAIAKFEKKKGIYMLNGFILAVVLHGTYNLVINNRNQFGLIGLCLGLISMFIFLLILIRKSKRKGKIKNKKN